MSCSKCKQKNRFKEEFEKTTDLVDKKIVWFIVVWSVLALYGIYSLIIKLL
jgi:hypothetical protein